MHACRMFLHAMEQVLESDPQAIDLRRGQATPHSKLLNTKWRLSSPVESAALLMILK